jgi:hypothetical protein
LISFFDYNKGNRHLSRYPYLGTMFETVTSLMEGVLELFEVELSSQVILPIENAGCFGFGRAVVSLANITTTVDMVGLSAASS